MKHTPGPWEVLHSKPLDTIAIAAKSGFSIPLAVLQKDNYLDNRMDNATLIAAAPDLLATLIWCAKLLVDPKPIHDSQKLIALEMINRTFKKVNGEE